MEEISKVIAMQNMVEEDGENCAGISLGDQIIWDEGYHQRS